MLSQSGYSPEEFKAYAAWLRSKGLGGFRKDAGRAPTEREHAERSKTQTLLADARRRDRLDPSDRP